MGNWMELNQNQTGQFCTTLYNHIKTCLRKCLPTSVSVLPSSRTIVTLMGVRTFRRGCKITLRGHEMTNGESQKQIYSAHYAIFPWFSLIILFFLWNSRQLQPFMPLKIKINHLSGRKSLHEWLSTGNWWQEARCKQFFVSKGTEAKNVGSTWSVLNNLKDFLELSLV